MPTEREDSIRHARAFEKQGDWVRAALNYLEASMPREALSAIKRLNTASDWARWIVESQYLAQMKQHGILEEAVGHLNALDICLDSLAENLGRLGEYTLAAEIHTKLGRYDDAAWAFARGKNKTAAADSLAKYVGVTLITYNPQYYEHICQLGFLDEFIERFLGRSESDAYSLVDVIAEWGREFKASFAAWKEKGGMDRLLKALGNAYRQSNQSAGVDSNLTPIEHAIKHRYPITNEEVSTYLAMLASYRRERGDQARAAQLWSDIAHLRSHSSEQKAAYSNAADCYIEAGDYARACAMLEKMDNEAEPPINQWLLERVAKLYGRAGLKKEAAAVYERSGRTAKAKRTRGQHEYNLEEARSLLHIILSYDPSCFSAEHRHVDPSTAVKDIEEDVRKRGEWFLAAKSYFSEVRYEEFDRICFEEDELEIAALWYAQANMPERAAKIYDLMGQSDNKSGNSHAEGAKQRPQDAAKPKSESTAETEEGTLEQMVCPQCGAEVKPHWLICPRCNTRLKEAKCKNCGELLDPDWKRCPACMTPVTGSG